MNLSMLLRSALPSATLALLCVAVGPLSEAQTLPTVAGGTPGTFSVTPNGAATYRIPIQVPPGTSGVEPKLELSYSSQSGNGMLGMGWGVAGLSTIRSCPQTMAQDGARSVSGNERYCLDGQRLILVSGTYGIAGSEYKTEIESFSRIKGYGIPGTGRVGYFIVNTKAGLTVEYGNTTNSRSVGLNVFAQNKVTDRKGNYLSVTYVADPGAGAYYPDRIDYTGNAGTAPALAPFASVRFTYQDGRPDIQSGYESGSTALLQVTKRMSVISTYIGATLVRAYRLAYTSWGPTQRSALETITECGATSCLPETGLTYRGTEDPDSATNNYVSSSGSNVSTAWVNPAATQVITGDFDGDGRTDFFLKNPAYASTPMYLSSSNIASGGFWAMTNNAIYSGGTNVSAAWINASATQVITGDFNGDGKTDFFLRNSTYGSTPIFLSKPDGTWNIINMANAAAYWANRATTEIITGDFNGDGLTDFIAKDANNYGTPLYLSNGDGTWTFSNVVPQYNGFDYPLGSGRMAVGDFNGDGKTDLLPLNTNDSGGQDMFLSLGNGTFEVITLGVSPGDLYIYNDLIGQLDTKVIVGDFNGDGKTDFILKNPTLTTTPLLLSTGFGYFADSNDAIYSGNTNVSTAWINATDADIVTGDFNGDGKTDLLIKKPGLQTSPILLSKGDGTWIVVDNALNVDTNNASALWINSAATQLITGDFNGNGATDFLLKSPSLTTTPFITSGLGNGPFLGSLSTQGERTNIEYRSLANNDQNNQIYTKDSGANLAVYPTVDLQPAQPVVSRTVTNYRDKHYTYGGLKAELATGRGVLGFRWTKVEVGDTALRSYAEYRQDWPYLGLTSKTEILQNASVLKRVTSTHACKIPLTGAACVVPQRCDLAINSAACLAATNTRYFPYVASDTEENWDLNLTALPVITSAYFYGQSPQYGDPTQITVSNGSGASKVTDNEYWPADTTNWILGRLKKATVTSVQP